MRGSMQTFRPLAIVLFSITALLGGQDAPEGPSFEVASVKPSNPHPQESVKNVGQPRAIVNSANLPPAGNPNRLSLYSISFQTLLQRAYGLKSYQISGPAWLGSERYDIVAKLPEGANRDQVPTMLRHLLTERFGLKARTERRTIPVYLMVVTKKGSALRSASGPSNRLNMSMTGPVRSLNGQMTLGNLVSLIARSLDRPVFDETGLEGYYSIDLAWSPQNMVAGGPIVSEPEPDLISALLKLGLKLDRAERAVDILVIDHAEKTPTEN
jgi:uncharacterized protein (TIGR03435 family)